MVEPAKRVISFIDGQNLYHSARQAFGYTYPNFDPVRLTQLVAAAAAWNVVGIRFYTGVPDQNENRPWYEFWTVRRNGDSGCGCVYSASHLPDPRDYRPKRVPG